MQLSASQMYHKGNFSFILLQPPLPCDYQLSLINSSHLKYASLKPWTLLWLRSSFWNDENDLMKLLLYLSQEQWHYKVKEIESWDGRMKMDISVENLSKMFDLNIWTSTQKTSYSVPEGSQSQRLFLRVLKKCKAWCVALGVFAFLRPKLQVGIMKMIKAAANSVWIYQSCSTRYLRERKPLKCWR